MQLTNVVLLVLATVLTACSSATPRRVTSADVHRAEVRFDRPERPVSHG